jgi:putative aldouronate transport system substrate-binding protein
MTNVINRSIVFLITFTFISSLLVGCINYDNKAMETKQSSISSEMVELQFYMIGDPPKDLELIQTEINKLAAEQLHTQVKFNFITWNDWDQKYRLLLTSGQPIDLIFTSEWSSYQSFAKKGAYLELDQLLPKVAPLLYDFIPQDMWDAVRINKKIYTIPSTWKEYVTEGITYREDLRKKYNLPIPDSLETLEDYLVGVKHNDPSITPLADTIVNHTSGVRHMTSKIVNANGVPPYGIQILYDNPRNITSYWGSKLHLDNLITYKRWMEEGLFPKNVLNIKEDQRNSLINGKSIALLNGQNPNQYLNVVNQVKSAHPEWKFSYVPFASMKGFAQPVHPIHNGFAIPINSKYPEEALAFYEKMVTDKRYNWLTQYGIEGTHFEVTDNGNYKPIGDPQESGFPREGMNGWAWRNPEFMLYDQNFDEVSDIFKTLDKVSRPDIFTGFAEDWTSYQAERAALEQVEKQYLYPLNVGLIDDVQAGLEKFMVEARKAGLDKIQKDYKKQWLQYLDEIGIQ